MAKALYGHMSTGRSTADVLAENTRLKARVAELEAEMALILSAHTADLASDLAVETLTDLADA